MTLYVYSNDVISGAGDAIIVPNHYDRVFVAPGVLVAATSGLVDNNGIYCGAQYQFLDIAGTVVGDSGIVAGHATRLLVTSEGHVAGGLAGVYALGDYCEIRNSGTISGTNAILSDFAIEIWNTGLISGRAAVSLSNYADTVVNRGTMVGDVELGDGDDTYDGAGGVALERISLGFGNDVATGGDGSEDFSGDGGDDEMSGGGGDDIFRCGQIFFGTDGNDIIDGGDGIDLYDAHTLAFGITVNLATGTAFGVQIGSDLLTGIEKVRGTNSDDTLIGGGKADILISGDGTDSLSGGGGNDRLSALWADGNKTMSGDAGNDRIVGGDSGVDTIDGGNGNDVIWGRYDTDLLTGGQGADRFVYRDVEELFRNAGPSVERITDFRPGADLIDLSAIDANTLNFELDDFVFIGTDAFTDAGQVRFEVRGANTLVQMSVYSAGVTGVLRLDGVLSLTADDFVL